MAKAIPKIALSVSRDIPFNKLVLSQSNVRRIKAGVAIEELAEDIARRTLLQSLTVRPVCDADGNETGLYEVPAGGRRYRALELLIKKKRLPKTAPIPCVIRTGGIAEEDSLAENVQRVPLHPLDQFRAFLALREKGQSEEEIAAAFFVSVAVVHQRLRLAAVAPKLLDAYAEDSMTLDQLIAFTVNPDHARQEQVWEALQRSYRSEPYQIRRMLTEGSVRVSDKRALFVGTTAYEEAGGTILRDLFESDDGGWLQEPALLEKLVADKLKREADAIRTEGWKWIEVAPELPYGHTYGLRRLRGKEVPMSDEEVAARDALQAELDQLEAKYAEADEIPEDVDQRLGEIETALAAFDERPVVYEPDEIARAGAFVSIDSAGVLHVERGYVQPEDESEAEGKEDDADDDETGSERATATGAETDTDDDPAIDGLDEDETEDVRPLSDRLMTELTTHRTLALRDAVANDPDVALRTALHALCLKLFYRYGFDTCLEIEAKSILFGNASGLSDTASAKAIDARHKHWAGQMPKNSADLWDVVADLDSDSRQALFAHCVGLTVNAVHQSYDRRPKALQHADRLATAVRLDMATAGWISTADSYLGRVTKARILDAVREAKGDKAADRIAHLKKAEMAKEAERLLDGTGWLPEPLRTADLEQTDGAEASRVMAAE
ncbi:MAG: ParB/RepB/Spo0J family partition protein [Hyphomicrobium zavarzinii]|jgi:ParB family chromosome partitioning protein|uniref:ParB/RepB/Spo0J family partition protein n=1 Tax=Hyphomicrobium zavarzinii TaxID=48292 RepID=UPI001A4FFE05|nr:ParB/RepB/Spo0J family partition protein [Hyphomicrobium zavarzinii]MBL8844569.1 ParB/RepB/Spo0J family partition protein [Hyphomicrobium zavarzinii]